MENALLILIGLVLVVVCGSLPWSTNLGGTGDRVLGTNDHLDRSLVDPDERIDEMRSAG